MKKISLYFLLFAIILSNCTVKNNIEPTSLNYSNLVKRGSLMPPSEYYKFLNQKSTAYFTLWYDGQNTPSDSMTLTNDLGYQAGGCINNEIGKYDCYDNGQITINNIAIPYRTSNSYYITDASTCKNFYGRNVVFQLPTSKNGMYIDSLYVPEKLQITNPVKKEGIKNCISAEQDLQIEWNSDRHNYNGVLVVITYPKIPSDNNGAGIGFAFAETVVDNGSFVIPKSAFDMIPKDRRENGKGATISIIRASFKSTNLGDSQWAKILGYSHIRISI